MSWHYSLELGADFSLPVYLAGLRSARSRSRSTPVKSSCSDSGTECSTSSQSGTMCEPSTVAPGVDSLMLFRGDFPAKTSARRVKVRDLPEPVVAFGLSICESLRKYGLDMSSRKTVRTCVPVDSAPSSKDLPAWGMTHDGVCWELGISVRRTDETGYGYWPTPTVSGNYNRKGASARSGDGLATAVRMWPTPQSSDNRDRGHMGMPAIRRRAAKGKQLNLSMVVSETSGALNPPWVEWLMGWVPGWTDLEPLATDKFQQWQQQHSGF